MEVTNEGTAVAGEPLTVLGLCWGKGEQVKMGVRLAQFVHGVRKAKAECFRLSPFLPATPHSNSNGPLVEEGTDGFTEVLE